MNGSPFNTPQIVRAEPDTPANRASESLIEFLSPSQLAAYVPPEGSRLVGDFHVTRGATLVIGGAPGVGKSRSLTALAIAGATGASWLGLPVHRTFRTMIVQNENGRFRLKSEFDSAACAELDEWIRVCPPPPQGLCFSREEFRSQLACEIEKFQPDVIGIDPWNAAARDDKAKDYLDTFSLIRTVIPAGDHAPALCIVAHTRKPHKDERANGRALLNLLAGSYVLGSVPRSVFVMQAASDDTEDDRIVWTCCKNNDGKVGARSAWVRQNGLFSPVEDFDWEAFDEQGDHKKPSYTRAVEAVRNANGPLTKAQIVNALKTSGVSQPTAYRWISAAVGAGELIGETEGGPFRVNS